MKRLSLFTLLLVFFLSACSPTTPVLKDEGKEQGPHAFATASPAKAPLTIVDALGRKVALPAAPQRVVITGKAVFMIADAAYLFPQAKEKIIALGNAGQGMHNFIQLVDPYYKAKHILAKDAGAEAVAALHPDLVLLKSYLAPSIGAAIEALGIPVIYIDLETPKQYTRDLTILGKVFGAEDRAQDILAFYQGKVHEITAAVQDAPKPRVLLLYFSAKNGHVAFNVPPMRWMQTQMVQMAGGEPVWGDANPGQGWTQVSLEQIAAWDPDQIFVISYFKPASEVVESLKADPNWQSLRAVRQGHLYAFASDFYSWDQPDPRWILGLTWLASKLHPDRFPALDMTTEVQQFYQTLYGLDKDVVQEKILPLGKGW